MTAVDATAAASGVRARRSLGRAEIMGVVSAVTGFALILAVAPTLTDEERSFAFELPPDPASVSFDPGVLISVLGAIYVLVGAVSVWGSRIPRVTRVAQAVGVALVPVAIITVALGRSDLASTNVVNLLSTSLILSTPIALGAMTGLWSERVGVINIGIEGMMLAAAGVGFTAYAVLGDAQDSWALWVAILVSVAVGGLLALLLAALAIRLRIDQIVAGVVINLFALGMTGFLRSQVIVPSGNSSGLTTPRFGIPLLEDIPVVGEQLFTGQPIYFMMYLVVFATWLVMMRTAWGMRVRACGEDPHAAETVGIDVVRTRYLSVVLGGFIAGLGGAWFSLEAAGRFEDNMTNSAGFIALAAMIFGRWTPWGAFAGALLFGFSNALQSRLQFLNVTIGGFEVPSEFWQALPFVMTILVVVGLVGRSRGPASAGQPFTPSK